LVILEGQIASWAQTELSENRQLSERRQPRAEKAGNNSRVRSRDRGRRRAGMPRAVQAGMTPHSSTLVGVGIAGLALLVVATVGLGVLGTAGRRAAGLFAVAVAAWLALSAALGLSGFFAHEGLPPRVLVLLLPTVGLPLLFGLSRTGALLANTPVWLLIAFHGFRLPLELVMHQAAAEGVMPPQMTFTGMNFDITTGVTALLVGALAARGWAPRWLLLGWNTLGTLLLVVIVTIAVASLPAFAAFGREPERLNTWVGYFPFVWLPAGLVSAAVLGHVLLWRRLLSYGMRGRASVPVS